MAFDSVIACTVIKLIKKTKGIGYTQLLDEQGFGLSVIPDGPRFSVFQLPTIWKFSVNKERN